MGIRKLVKHSEIRNSYLRQFHDGDQRALNFVYQNSFYSLLFFGKSLINDEFLITCILHDCFLKAWTNRKRMESLQHIYRFIRMNLRWQILRHIENSRNSIYGQMLSLDQFEGTIGNFEDTIEEQESWKEDTQKLRITTECIRYLPADAQQIVKLHFQQDLTHKQIAARLGKSTSHVANQINKSVKQIKTMVVAALSCRPNNSACSQNITPGILDSQQFKIYDLRKNQKLSFDDIAAKLGLSRPQTQQQYIKAHQLLQNQSRQKESRRF